MKINPLTDYYKSVFSVLLRGIINHPFVSTHHPFVSTQFSFKFVKLFTIVYIIIRQGTPLGLAVEMN